MFIRQKKNKSGSISVQIISNHSGFYKVIKTIGCSSDAKQIERLVYQAQQEITKVTGQASLFVYEQDDWIEGFLSSLSNQQVRSVGPELIVGKIYDFIGYNIVKEDLFRHLVIARLAFPLSKLKTIEYVFRYQGVTLNIDKVYRFLDTLHEHLKGTIEQISFQHTKRILKGQLSIVFYDLTTLYFEASDEDDLRQLGFNKDGKHNNPQIHLGLLVGLGGYAIGYEIFEGSMFEGHTLLPMIKNMSTKFDLGKPIIIADAGLLSTKNINDLEKDNFEYILGARLKNESASVKEIISQTAFQNNQVIVLEQGKQKLIVQYSEKRAKKDFANREKGLRRLEKQIKSGKLTKKNVNNRGYNKYLKMIGDITISIDQDKFTKDQTWDGLKGYVTNCKLSPMDVIENYRNLWHIEKAFRMSKTDLRIRPIYHRLRRRIEAHICISFVAYTIYKELERVLKLENYPLSIEKAMELTHTMYQIEIMLPNSMIQKKILLKMDKNQMLLKNIVDRNF